MSLEPVDRGAKHRCLACNTVFYDLKKPRIVCPRCGVDQAEAAKLQKAGTKKGHTRAPPKPQKSIAPALAREEETAEDDEPAEDPQADEALDDEDDEAP